MPEVVLHTLCTPQAFARIIQAHPSVLVLSLLVLFAALGLGLLAVLLSAHAYEKQEKEETMAWATNLVNHITQALEVSVARSTQSSMLPPSVHAIRDSRREHYAHEAKPRQPRASHHP